MRQVCLFTCLILCACTSTPRSADPQRTEPAVTALFEQLQPTNIIVEGDPFETTTLAELRSEYQTPGVSVAVIRNGEVEWERGFGVADVETGREVTERTLFQAASISKPVTAAAALTLVQDGLLDLDEDVNLKLKSWKLPTNEFTAEQPVTLRHLLSHTAGTTVHGFPGYPRDVDWPSMIDVLEGRGNTDPVRVDTVPGTNWRYSGGGYTLIGQLMMDVTGKPYAEIIRERVLEPAGMTHSTYAQPLPVAYERETATAYAHDGSAVAGRYHTYPGGGGLWTTAGDLARFAVAIQRSRAGEPGSLLSSSLAKEMLTPVMNHYGLGFGVSEDGERFGHSGSNAGFLCLMSASLDDGWGIAVMTNGDAGFTICRQVRRAAAAAYGWSGPEAIRRKRVDIGDVALSRLAGFYEAVPETAHARSRVALFPNMGTLELKATNGRLVADVPPGAGTEGRVEFLPQSELQLQERRTGRMMDFIVEAGQVTGFNFRDFEAKRVEEPKAGNASSGRNRFGLAILREGSRGPEVSALQEALNSQLKPHPDLPISGFFGHRTEAAVVEFQKQAGIAIDGLVGPQTKAALLGPGVDAYFVECSGITSDKAPQVITRNVLQDRNGGHWLATWNGIVRFDGTTFTNVTNKEGLRRYRAFSLLEDHAGNIWLGTTGAGVYRFDGSRYTNYTTKDGLGDDTVLSMMQDRDNSIWFGGGGGNGVTKYDGTTFTSFTAEDGFTKGDVCSISQAPDGSLWFGTRGALFRFDGNTFVNFTEKHGVTIDPNSYTPAIIDRRGHVWFGGTRGVYHYDGKEVRHLFEPQSFSLFEDSKGRIWFSGGEGPGPTPPGGITVLNRFDPSAGLDNLLATREQIVVRAGAIFDLSEDKDGDIWFGTGSGIGRIEGETVHFYDE